MLTKLSDYLQVNTQLNIEQIWLSEFCKYSDQPIKRKLNATFLQQSLTNIPHLPPRHATPRVRQTDCRVGVPNRVVLNTWALC